MKFTHILKYNTKFRNRLY